MAHFDFVAGRLLCSEIRSYLEAERFKGRKIEWLEGSGILERRFTVRGEAADVKVVFRELGRLNDG